MIHSLLQARPCPAPGRAFSMLAPSPGAVQSSPSSPALPNVKLCQLSQAPQRGFKDFWWGATVARHPLSPSWSWDGYEGGTLCLTSPGQAYPGLAVPNPAAGDWQL